MTLIKRVSNSDRRYLRQLPSDTQGLLHGLFVVREYTGEPEIQRVWRLKDALSAIDRHRLYHFVASEFSCVHEERNWKGLDITVRFRIRICPTEKGFARWLLMEDTGAWDDTRTKIYASDLEAVIQSDTQYGLVSYVRACLNQVHLELLKDHGAASWPYSIATKFRMPWLEVVSVEDVKCLPHTATVRVVDVRPGTVLCGQYKLVNRLGQGGMGQVWKAEDLSLHTNVAIKVLAENAAQDLTDTIEKEARVLKSLAHENIANMRGYHIDGNVSFMVIDFVEGCSLEDILLQRKNNQGRLTDEEVLEWLKPIASAIDYVHKKNVVHRDIKPQNIMIGRKAGDDKNIPLRPFLCDFGIASKNSNVTQAAWGTPPYCAPEITPGAEVTAAADIYSFSVMLFRCLTGKFPFATDSDGACKSCYIGSVKKGLSRRAVNRPQKCLDLFRPSRDDNSIIIDHEDEKGDGSSVVLSDNIILPIKVIDDYQCLLGRCGKSDIVRKMKTLGKDVKHKGERTGWRISNTSAFIELIASVPVIAVDEMRTNRAADRHGEIMAWFRNHRIDKEFDSATKAILERIHDSITNTSEED